MSDLLIQSNPSALLLLIPRLELCRLGARYSCMQLDVRDEVRSELSKAPEESSRGIRSTCRKSSALPFHIAATVSTPVKLKCCKHSRAQLGLATHQEEVYIVMLNGAAVRSGSHVKLLICTGRVDSCCASIEGSCLHVLPSVIYATY
jgi:hypothetical protein